MQNLEEEDALALRRIVALWKPHREALFRAEVIPVGEEPDGRAFTGFLAKTGEKEGYLILLRELNGETETVFRLPLPAGSHFLCRSISARIFPHLFPLFFLSLLQHLRHLAHRGRKAGVAG